MSVDKLKSIQNVKDGNLFKGEPVKVQSKGIGYVVEDYIEGLKILKVKYDDQEYLNFIDDLESNDYILAFAKSTSLATMREVPENKKLGTKTDIDNFFKKQK